MKTAGFESRRLLLKFVIPPPDLAPYISTFYYTQVASGDPVMDWMHPEWGNLRIGRAETYEAGVGTEPLRPVQPIVLSGPTSHAMQFRIEGGRFWGIGLLPLGWAKFIRRPACDFADEFPQIEGDPHFSDITKILRPLLETQGDLDADVARLVDGFRSLLEEARPDEAAIQRVHRALVEPEIDSVTELAERAGMSVRTLERFSRRVFGFSPKVLIRRQRFLRSLSQFMLDPSMSWIESLDEQYYDQAHFVREFREFMTMSPSEYAALEKPILTAAVIARKAAAGDAMQVLQKPEA